MLRPACLSDRPPATRWRTRAVQLVLFAFFILLPLATAQSGTFGLGGLGGGMPWEGPLQQLLDSLTGPVSQVVGAVAIIGLGIGIAFSEGGSMMRKALWVVMGLAIAFNAVSWGLGFLGYSRGPARMSERPDGFEVPLHRSLVEPMLLAGLPRTVALVLWTSVGACAFGLHQVWVAARRHRPPPRGRRGDASSDPHVLRHRPCRHARRSGVWTPTPSEEKRLPMFSLREYREPIQPLARPPAVGVPGGPRRRPAEGRRLSEDARVPRARTSRARSTRSSSSASARLNNALRRLGSGWGLFIEAQRFVSSAYPRATWPHPAAAVVDLERRRAFEQAGAHYESSYYLTFTWRLPPDARRARPAFSTTTGAAGARARAAALERELYALPKDGRRDGRHSRRCLPRGRRARRRSDALVPPQHDLDPSAPGARVPRRPRTSTRSCPTCRSRRATCRCSATTFFAPAPSSGFPVSTLPGLLDALNHLERRVPLGDAVLVPGQGGGQGALEKYRKQWWSKRKGLWTMIKEEASSRRPRSSTTPRPTRPPTRTRALQELGDDLVVVRVPDDDRHGVGQDLEEARRRPAGQGGHPVARLHREGRDAELDPGVARESARPRLRQRPAADRQLHEPRASHAAQQRVGRRRGQPAPGERLRGRLSAPLLQHDGVDALSPSPRRRRRRPHAHHRPHGSGKSTLLGMLALGWLKYPGAQVVLFDKDRSARAATLAVGGTCYEPGKERRAYRVSAARRHRPARGAGLGGAVRGDALGGAGRPVGPPRSSRHRRDARWRSRPHRARADAHALGDELGSRQRALRDALRPYTLEGNFGQIFDADRDDVPTGGAWTMIEMGHLMAMGPAVVVPALEYLFHRVESAVRRAPDAPHPGRGLAFSQPPDLRDGVCRLAQDAA